MDTSGCIIPFENERFGTIRALSVDGEPWFVAKDVCDILGVATNHLREEGRGLDEDEVMNLPNWENGGKTPLIVSEPGLYKLVMRSRKPETKAFQRWVTHDVLPSIRQTGAYSMASETPMQLVSRALIVANDEIQRRDFIIQSLEAENDALYPKALAADSFMECDGTYTVTEAARMLRQADGSMSRRRLFSLLRDDGLMERRGKQATARAVERGYLVNVATSFTAPDGRRIAREPYALVTPKGLSWMVGRYCSSQRRIPLALVEGVA